MSRLALVAAAAVFLASCVGCTDDGGGDDDGGGPTTVDPGDIVEGGTMRLGLAGPVVVDPALANPASPSDLMVLDLLHDGLVRVGTTGELVAQVAAKWRSNRDQTVWVFELDPAATFASGEPITNDVVVASLEHLLAAGQSSLPALRLEAVEGFAKFTAGTADHVTGLEARDDGSVAIHLARPMSVLPWILAAPEMGIVDVAGVKAVSDDAGATDLDLTGSWALAAADATSLRVERRDGRPGHLDAVELRSFDDGAAAYTAFEAGDVDWALIPGDRFDDATSDHGDDQLAPFHAEVFFGLRVASGPLKKGPLRRAIAAAIDREEIVEEVYADRAEVLSTLVPAGVSGHDDGICPECAHDPDRAREILEEAYPDGKVPVVHLDFDESEIQTALAELVADQLDEVGITTKLRPKPLEDYRRFVVSGKQELFSFGWIGGYLSPDAYLRPLFASTADDNLTGVADEQVDDALAAARRTQDAGEALAQWSAAERRILRLAVVVPIAQFRTQPVVASRVEGFGHAVDGSVDWSTVFVTDGST